MNSLTLSFNQVNLIPVEIKDSQIWLSSSDLAKALGYKQSRAVTKIYNSNADEFTKNMTRIIEVPNLGTSAENKGLRVKTRIFSLRGCHLIAMFSRTKVAKDFRKWVLDILDNEVGKPKLVGELTPEQTLPLRDAVNSLVTKAGIMYPEAYKMVHQRFNISHIKQLQPEQVVEAVEYVHKLTLIKVGNPNFNLEYLHKVFSMGTESTDWINQAVGVAEKHMKTLEDSLESLATSIDVIKTHNANNFSVFESLRWQAPAIEK